MDADVRVAVDGNVGHGQVVELFSGRHELLDGEAVGVPAHQLEPAAGGELAPAHVLGESLDVRAVHLGRPHGVLLVPGGVEYPALGLHPAREAAHDLLAEGLGGRGVVQDLRAPLIGVIERLVALLGRDLLEAGNARPDGLEHRVLVRCAADRPPVIGVSKPVLGVILQERFEELPGLVDPARGVVLPRLLVSLVGRRQAQGHRHSRNHREGTEE